MGISMKNDYYVGLDLGTSSVGWAVTTSDYNLIRKKGKDLWGVRLFPEAKTAAERRSNRTSRRRLQRQHARIGFLKEMFHDEIEKVDPNFYMRLEDSKFYVEDKREQQKNALFNDRNFTDKDYYKKYPTIFHLRNELINSDEPHDIRLVYLAILNIFKHRGHFLNSNIGDEGLENIEDIVNELNEQYSICFEEEFASLSSLLASSEILASNKYSPSNKCEHIANLCCINKSSNKAKYELLKAICGMTVKLEPLIPRSDDDEPYDDETKKLKLSFSGSDLEEKLSVIEGTISNDEYELLLIVKRLVSWSSLSGIMSGEGIKYLSQARISMYKKHEKDLALLKNVYRQNAPELYDKMFRIMEKGNYSEYVGSVNSKLVFERRNKSRSNNYNRTDEFFALVKKQILQMEQNQDTEYILSEIEKRTFLPKQLSGNNGIIPYQLHKIELVKILDNASRYLPFLLNKDESNLTVAQRIVQVFEFNIPYFIGPLRTTQNGTGWSKVSGSGKILPWNIRQRIDFVESEKEFILRMIRHCTYLNNELVVPRESLIYQKFCVLNELNNLQINNVKPSVELKQKLYTDLFCKGKKVKVKLLKEFLVREGFISKDQEVKFSGFDKDLNNEFTNTLSSYKKFCEVFEVNTLSNEQEKLAEEIILLLTIHSGDKKVIKEKLSQKFESKLSKQQIDRLSGYRFKDFGRFSREFLTLKGNDEGISIIERLWNTNDNLMEIINGNYGFSEIIKEKCNSIDTSLADFKFEDMDDLYLSNPVKRMVWQTVAILREIEKVMGYEPSKVFVEMTRGEGEKKRTVGRQKRLEALYNSCKKEEPYLFSRIKTETDSSLRVKKLYLYYMQKGRCMYTGDRIELNDLMNDNLYDIDHIYPRHFIKDDSLENNLVLVKKVDNSQKLDNYPIDSTTRNRNHAFWKTLFDGEFISKTKYERLIRTTPFSQEEKASFIERQLVETSQAAKAVTNLLEKLYTSSKVIYVKAGNVSQFRQDKDMIKVRSINDLHHANDAYLNIVVGNVYNVKFTNNPLNFIKDSDRNPESNKYHLYHMFDYDVKRGEEIAWIKDKSMAAVKKVMQRGTPLVTYKNYEAHGALTGKDTLYSSSIAKQDSYFPISSSDGRLSKVGKYGGRMGTTGTYFFLVEHTVKGMRIRTIEPMFLYLAERLKTRTDIEEYCRTSLGYIDPDVRLEKILMYSKLKINGYEVYLTGRTNDQLSISNAFQLKLTYDDAVYYKKIEKALENGADEAKLDADKITKDNNLIFFNNIIQKLENSIYRHRPNSILIKMRENKDNFKTLELKNQCKILTEIIKAFKKENSVINFDLFGKGMSSIGKLYTSKAIWRLSECILINQSVTGIYESRIDLLTV